MIRENAGRQSRSVHHIAHRLRGQLRRASIDLVAMKCRHLELARCALHVLATTQLIGLLSHGAARPKPDRQDGSMRAAHCSPGRDSSRRAPSRTTCMRRQSEDVPACKLVTRQQCRSRTRPVRACLEWEDAILVPKSGLFV